MRIARDELHLHRVQAATLLRNEASQAVLRKCGFTEFGVAADYLHIAGSWQDPPTVPTHPDFVRADYVAV